MASTKVVIFGDSQVSEGLRLHGFGTQLNHRFGGAADLSLRSFPGYSTSWLKLVVGGSLKNVGSTPDYVVILAGRDDLIQKSTADAQSTPPPKEFGDSMDQLVRKITDVLDIQIKNLFLLSPMPVHKMRLNPDLFTVNTDLISRYTDEVKKAATKSGASFIDTAALLNPGLDGNIEEDGITLTAAGHAVLADALEKVMDISESPYPAFDKVSSVEELKQISKKLLVVAPDNISAYTHVNRVDQYSAYVRRSSSANPSRRASRVSNSEPPTPE